QQDVRVRGENARERCPAGLAAGQPRDLLVTFEAELLQQIARLMQIVPRGKPSLHVSQCRGRAGKVRLLWQISNRGTGLHKTDAAVRFNQTARHYPPRTFD